ncbi:MAG: hypothetical protein QXJ93_02300 [Candidatus Rehaiarchaeum fermentans]|nr:hypothetical protein [Candidatus Rehaiarchaeum fermentans]
MDLIKFGYGNIIHYVLIYKIMAQSMRKSIESQIFYSQKIQELNRNKPIEKQIKQFNFMLIVSDTNGFAKSSMLREFINSLTFSDIHYKQFID